VSFDNIGNGIAGTAFIAYMSSLTNTAYTATQYALFGTLWSLPAKSIASQWGRIVDHFGYPPFFIYTAVIAVPALVLIVWFLRRTPTTTST
jgi:MFS transporter, PAT family, beta-lactamase induction signal transducer AmpG